MQASEVKTLIEQQLPNVQVEVDGEGCDFQLLLISDELAALSPVKRQQRIYALLTDPIADGRIHAVTMKFFTREAWASRS
ncbi:MAG: BolA family protein [Pseudomonas sp.]